MSISTVNRQPNYSDLDLDFLKNPATNDVVRKTGEDAIKRSIRNLLLLNYFEKPFQSYIGSNVRTLLFEPMTSATEFMLQQAIRTCIENFEPRVKLIDINITYDTQEYGFYVTLNYIIINKNLPVITTIFLERIR